MLDFHLGAVGQGDGALDVIELDKQVLLVGLVDKFLGYQRHVLPPDDFVGLFVGLEDDEVASLVQDGA